MHKKNENKNEFSNDFIVVALNASKSHAVAPHDGETPNALHFDI